MSGLPFWKVQSVGNDFVLVLLDDIPADALSELAVRASARRFGVGSDGLLAVGKEGERISLRMFNPDGTEDFCGNGLRCAGLFAFLMRWVGQEFEILHLDRVVPTTIEAIDSPSARIAGVSAQVSTVIGMASFEPSKVPMVGHHADELFEGCLEVDGQNLTVSSLSTGSTHTVVFVDALPADAELLRLGPLIEHHRLFPERTSVVWTVVEAADRLRIRIWERGLGETQGCGTGSSAAVAVHLRKLGSGGAVDVINPGGTVHVEMASWDDQITASSRAEIVYEGRIPLNLFRP